jgi:putative FmdB family regulatory protein
MPIYEYQCTSCHHQFDLIQKISDEPVKECPDCHKDTAIKLISAAGFQLKGSGWYVTDFKNKNNAPATKKNETTATTETHSTGTAESKSTKGGAE